MGSLDRPANGIVACMFTDLVGSTEVLVRLGDDEAERWRVTHFKLLREAIEASSGKVIKSVGDGVEVVFENTVDAISCAVAMQRAMARHNRRPGAEPYEMRLGINVGDVIYDDGEYYGAAIVLAQRLCNRSAPGQILVTQLVCGLVGSRGGFTFESVGELALKGMGAPVAAYEVVWDEDGSRAIPLPPKVIDATRSAVEFVGRAEQLEKLRAQWQMAQEDVRQMALLAGDLGVGKSRLATEFCLEAHAHGAVVLYGRCRDECPSPFAPAIEALGHYVEFCPLDELRERVEIAWPELAGLMPALLERFPDVQPPPAGRPPADALEAREMEAIGALLLGAAELDPVLLVLDDLQWADRATLRLIKYVLHSESPGPFLVLGIYRDADVAVDHPLSETIGDLSRERLFRRLPVHGLDEEATARLIRAFFGCEVPADYAREVWTETEGNPFFVEEVLRHLIEAGVVRRDYKGRWKFEERRGSLGIPDRIAEVADRRLLRLPADGRTPIEIAAAIGRVFDFDVLERVSPVKGDELFDVLDRALESRLIAEVPAAPPGRLRFSHPIVRSTVYERLPRLKRARWHARIGEALIEVYGANADAHAGELADHFDRADGTEHARDAARFAAACADRARSRGDRDEALHRYDQAIGALRRVEHQPSELEQLQRARDELEPPVAASA